MNKSAARLFWIFPMLLVSWTVDSQALPDGNEIMKEVDRIRYPETFYMRVMMETLSPNEANKSLTMENTYKKGFGTFMELLAPARSKGTKFLSQEQTLWMYNPKSGSSKPIRLAPRDSFQGSAFSNSDVSRTTFADDYNSTVEAEETIEHPEFGKVQVYRLRADASHPEAPYGKIVMWLKKDNLLPMKMDYYAKSGLLFRRMVLSQYKELAGRLRATRMEMESMDKIGTKSVITIQQMEVRPNIPESLYNLNNLTR